MNQVQNTPAQDGAASVHNALAAVVDVYGKLLATQIAETNAARAEAAVLRLKLAQEAEHQVESKKLHDRIEAELTRLEKVSSDLHVKNGELEMDLRKLTTRIAELEDEPPKPEPEEVPEPIRRGYKS